jgi:UDP-N-acetylmuramyl pentapeptide synthase
MKKFTKKNIEYFDSKKELDSKAKELIKQDTIILVKASRSMNFEVIINELRS